MIKEQNLRKGSVLFLPSDKCMHRKCISISTILCPLKGRLLAFIGGSQIPIMNLTKQLAKHV